MNKTKILAFIALAAILSACGSDEGSPPELINNEIEISPFDTLVVRFNSNLIGLDTIGESNVVLNNGTWVKKTSSKELYFIGANTTPGGSHYFSGGKRDSIVFKNIKNSDYLKDRVAFKFFTPVILDNEPNNREEDANDVESLGNNITEGITFAGVIDKYMGTGADGFRKEDKEDFYKFNLKRDDIISITISNNTKISNTPLKVRFFGVCNSANKGTCNDKTDSTTTAKKNTITLMDTVLTGHLQGSDSLNTVYPFYIKIFENTNDKSNPYIVTVKKLVKKS